MFYRLGYIALAILIVCHSLVKAETDYYQKNISYIKAIAVLKPSKGVTKSQKQIAAYKFGNNVNLGRFAIDTLPSLMIKDYQKKLGKQIDDLSTIKEYLNETVVEEFREIVSSKALARSKQLEDEIDYNRFIGEKAKELSITSEDLAIILNSGFICAPFLIKSKATTYGLAWYQLKFENDSASIVFIDSVTQNDHYLSIEDIAERLSEKSRRLDPFVLKQQITSVNGSSIEIYFDESQDISLDDKFYIKENIQNQSGEIKERRVGYGRVANLGDYKKGEPSYVKVIKNNARIVPGMLLEEHSLSHMNIRLGLQTFQYKITKGIIRADVAPEGIIVFPEDKVGIAYLARAGIAWNLSRQLKINQAYFTADVLIGGGGVVSDSLMGSAGVGNGGIPLLFGGELGLMKKFYIGSVLLTTEADAGFVLHWQHYSVDGPSIPDSTKMTASLVGGYLGYKAGLEYSLSIDFCLGISAGYKISLKNKAWVIEYGQGEDKPEIPISSEDYPILDLGGFDIRVYVTRNIL